MPNLVQFYIGRGVYWDPKMCQVIHEQPLIVSLSFWQLNDPDRADSSTWPTVRPSRAPGELSGSVVSQLPPSKYRWTSDSLWPAWLQTWPPPWSAGCPPSPPSASSPCSVCWQQARQYPGRLTVLRSGRPQSVSPGLPSKSVSSSSTNPFPILSNQEKSLKQKIVHIWKYYQSCHLKADKHCKPLSSIHAYRQFKISIGVYR